MIRFRRVQRRLSFCSSVFVAAAVAPAGRIRGRQAAGRHDVVGCQRGQTSDVIFELPDVARPVVAVQRVQHVVGHGEIRHPAGGTEAPEKVVDEHRDFRAPRAERGYVEPHYVEPEVQVLAKRTVAHALVDGGVRRDDDPHVDVNWFLGAERVDVPTVEEAQELGLHGRFQIGNLVQEQRAVLRAPNHAPVVPGCAGVGAAAVTEEHALRHSGRYFGAIERGELPLSARRVLVDETSDDFLAGPRLADNKYGLVARRDAASARQQPGHGWGREYAVVASRRQVRQPERELAALAHAD